MKSYTHSIFVKLGIPPALAFGVFGIYHLLFNQTDTAKPILIIGLAIFLSVFVILVSILYFKTALNTYFVTDDGLMVKSPFQTKVVAWNEVAWARINDPLKYIRVIGRDGKTIVFSSVDAFPNVQSFLDEIFTRSGCKVVRPKFKAFNFVLFIAAIVMTGILVGLFRDDMELTIMGERATGTITAVEELEPLIESRGGDFEARYTFPYQDEVIDGVTTVAPKEVPEIGETVNITFSIANPSLSKFTSQVSLRWIIALAFAIYFIVFTIARAIKFSAALERGDR